MIIRKEFTTTLAIAFFIVTQSSLIITAQINRQKLELKSWETLTFPIFSWLGPSSHIVSDTIFRDLSDAGFNLNWSADFFKPGTGTGIPATLEENIRMLNIAEKVGLRLLIFDKRLLFQKPLEDNYFSKLDSVISDYKNYKAFMGYILYDEPGASKFNSLAQIKDYIISHDSSHLVYINVFPNYANAETQLESPSYRDYLSDYLIKVRPQLLSFDNYPIYEGELRPLYFDNLEIIRGAAIANDIPFWAFALTTSHDLYETPNEGTLRFQLYCDLVYGAKGLQYFTYGFVPNFSHYAPTDSLGNKTPLWYLIKDINHEILKLTPVLNLLRSADVYHSFPLPQGTQPIPEDFYVQITDSVPMVVGHFINNKGTHYIMPVNRNFRQKIVTNLEFSDSVIRVFEISNLSGKEIPLMLLDSGKTAPIELRAGEGKLLRIQRKEDSFLSVSADSITIDSDLRSSTNFKIFSNLNWKVNCDQDWLSLSNYSGCDSALINLKAHPNPETEQRIAKITISNERYISRSITVIQSAIPDIKIYPNPSRSQLNILIPGSLIGSELKLYSLNGKRLFSTKINSMKILIDVTRYTEGVYLIEVVTKDATVSKKIIIKSS
jgi:hypothetical protein